MEIIYYDTHTAIYIKIGLSSDNYSPLVASCLNNIN